MDGMLIFSFQPKNDLHDKQSRIQSVQVYESKIMTVIVQTTACFVVFIMTWRLRLNFKTSYHIFQTSQVVLENGEGTWD